MLSTKSLTGLIIGSGVVAGLVAFSLMNNSSRPAVAADDTSEATTNALYAPLAEPAQLSDQLPPFLVSGNQALPDIEADTARALGEREGARYWLALNSDKKTCLISLMPGADQLASMTCQTAGYIWGHGLGLQVETANTAVRVYFTPEGYSTAVPGYDHVGSQLVAADVSTEGKRA